ncbi:MAG: hypothetical protein WBN17_04080 [Aureibaculum sp.]
MVQINGSNVTRRLPNNEEIDMNKVVILLQATAIRCEIDLGDQFLKTPACPL